MTTLTNSKPKPESDACLDVLLTANIGNLDALAALCGRFEGMLDRMDGERPPGVAENREDHPCGLYGKLNAVQLKTAEQLVRLGAVADELERFV